ncbi:MAG: BREX system ATP-binding domain-containing protein [Myxococcota bacterium]
MKLPRDVALHVFERLRVGAVPDRGLEAFAVGVGPPRQEIERQLTMVAAGEGLVKFLSGPTGVGKTFLARLACVDARRLGFATSCIEVGERNLGAHAGLLHDVCASLSTATALSSALGDILDRWFARQEQAVQSAGADPDAPDFDRRVRRRIEDELGSGRLAEAPRDFTRCVLAIFDSKQAGRYAEASALLAWLGGSANVAGAFKRAAGLKGEIASEDALAYLRGMLHIARSARYRGIVVVIDELQRLLHARANARRAALDGLRLLVDEAPSFPGLYWIFAGTDEFFDSHRGVAGHPSLHSRIRLVGHDGDASLRQPRIELQPFDAERLRSVGLALRDLYPTDDRPWLENRVSADRIDTLIADLSSATWSDMGVVPREFLRRLVELMDRAEAAHRPLALP